MELAASAWTALTTAFVTAAPASTAAASTAAAGTAAAAGSAAAGFSAAAGSAAAGTAAAGATAAGSGILSGLQGALTISSAIASVLGGVAAYRSHKDQAMFAELDADGARIAAEADALRIRRELVQRVGDTRVAFAGAGLDISSGGAIEDSLRDQADFEIGNAMDAGRRGRAGGMARAASLASQGQAGLVTGIGRAAERGVDYGLDLRKRG